MLCCDDDASAKTQPLNHSRNVPIIAMLCYADVCLIRRSAMPRVASFEDGDVDYSMAEAPAPDEALRHKGNYQSRRFLGFAPH